MIKETVILGTAGIILGVSIFAKTHAILPSLIPAAIGIALILFSKEECKIENRKDIKPKKSK